MDACLYETMVFKYLRKCKKPGDMKDGYTCGGCGAPVHTCREIAQARCMTRREAQANHMRLCREFANKQ